MSSALKSECRKFSANIFNKTKCQNCFRTKEAHSAEALESNRASRKVSKCGYLFVAPDWDFTVSINRTKRWQRRWFVLYDDGELTYSVDEHPDTVPQAVIDMNKVLEVSDAEDVTGNQFAIAITAPEKVHFVKGTSREESRWWFDVLSMLPRNNVRGKHKRNATFPGIKATTTPAAIISDHKKTSEDQNQCPDVVQRPRFLSTSETCRTNLKDFPWLHQVNNNNDEDVFPTKDYNSGDDSNHHHLMIEEANGTINNSGDPEDDDDDDIDDEGDHRVNSPTEVELNNALNNLITSAVQLSQQRPTAGIQYGSLEDNADIVLLAKEEDPKENNVSTVDNPQDAEAVLKVAAAVQRSRRYQKRENRNLRSQRSRSDGVAKMIPNRDEVDMLSPKSAKGDSELFGYSSLSPVDMSSPIVHPSTAGHRLESINGKMSPVPSRRRHRSDTVEQNGNSAPKRIIDKKGPNNGRCTLKKSESLMNIASELSPELRNKISELKRNYSYKGSPSMYRSKHESPGSSNSGVVTNRTANNPFIRPVRDTDPKPPSDNNYDNRKSVPSSHLGSAHSWDSGFGLGAEDSLVKKGWLMRQTLTKDWSRHWFVLRNASLTYYRDPSAEDCGIMDGVLDLNQVTNINEIESSDGAYAFCLIMWDNKKYVLASVSPDIRCSWIKAIQCASNLWDSESRKDFSQNEIVLPDHIFHNSNTNLAKVHEKVPQQQLSVSSTPCVTPDYDNTVDSSDDQSEYFSIVDEEEVADRSTSPRTLPPSPPVNRNAMSLVKERSRTRGSGAVACSSPVKESDSLQANSNEQYTDCGKTKDSIKAIEKGTDLRLPKACDQNQQDVPIKSHVERNDSQSLTDDHNSSIHDSTVSKSVRKAMDSNSLKIMSSSTVNDNKQNDGKSSSVESSKPAAVDVVVELDSPVKCDAWKSKCLQNTVDWGEKKAKKEKQQLCAKEGFDSTLRVLQKTRHLLADMKVKLSDSDGYQKNIDAVQCLCGELEKLSRTYEKRYKRDNEVKKLRKNLTDLRSLCCDKQTKIEEEQSKYSSLSSIVQKKEDQLRELQQEVDRLRSLCSLQCANSARSGLSRQNSSEKTIGSDCSNCIALSAKLGSAQTQLRKLQRELKDSHTSFDDLDITCFKLKQDLKAQDEAHQSQLVLMTARVDDLTSKYTLSEKNLRLLKQKMAKMETKQERRRSSLKNKESLSLSKECEAKIFELEQKVSAIEDEFRRSSLASREDISLPSSDLQSEASEIADVDSSMNLRKRLSQDSTSGSENTGILMRLHSLGVRVKNIGEAAEKHAVEQSESCSLDRPKICLQQLRNEEESIAQDEDWSTLSYTTSITDLQTIDCLENDLPTTWSDYYECLDQKLESLFSWLKLTIGALQKQENSYASDGFLNKDMTVFYSNVTDVLENIPDLKFEDSLVAGTPCDAIKIHYRTALVNETTRALQKLLSCESGDALEKFAVCEKAFGFIWNHFQLLENSENSIASEVSSCVNLVEKMLSVCVTPYESFLNSVVDIDHVSHQPLSRISILEKYSSELLELLDRTKESLFSALYQVLADVPVQDDDDTDGSSGTLQSENIDETHPLLENIVVTLKEFYELSVQDLFGSHHEGSTILQWEEIAYKSWSSIACEILKTEAESVIDDLKKICPQFRQQNESLFGFSDALYKKIVYASVDFARIAMIRALTHSASNFLASEGQTVDTVDPKEWAASIHSNLCEKAISLARGETDLCNHRQVAELLVFDYAMRSGTREMKMSEQLEAIHHLHQKELETVHADAESLQQENLRLKNYYGICDGTGNKLQELQSKLDQISKEQNCDQCESLCVQLQTLKEQHEGDMFAIRKQQKDKTEELHKHLQLVLEQKDEIHLREVQKLEDQLQTAQRKLGHIEVEYNEQIQSLRELYEKKTSLIQDPINEESIRRRYQGEIQQLKGLCEKGLTAMENSYRRITVELERRHKQELSVLEAEKEKALQEETQATLTALEVMRRAHAEELQREIAHFKEEFLKKMQAGLESEAFHQQHESEIEEIKREIMSVSEKYSVKCLEIASLEERAEVLQHQLQEANHQLFDLTARNKQLKVHLGLDIAQKKELLEDETNDPDSLESAKLLLELKDSELAEQQELNAQLKQELHLAQMHVSVLDVQCEQLNQSLKTERRLREDEVNSLRSRLEALVSPSASSSSSVAASDEGIKATEQRVYGRRTVNTATSRGFLHRSPSLNLPSHRLETASPWRLHTFMRTKELLRSPSCPGLEGRTPM